MLYPYSACALPLTEGLRVFQTIRRVNICGTIGPNGPGGVCREEEAIFGRTNYRSVATSRPGRADRQPVPQDRALGAELLPVEKGLRAICSRVRRAS